MRVQLLWLAVVFAAFVALPETRGAPTSVSIAEEKSKKSERQAQEDKEVAESSYKSSNGLESSTKSLSESKQSSALDEEQSHSVIEKETATGTQKVEKSVKKKVAVTVSEKKTVLLYFLKSYKRLPKIKSGECKVDYYKRVFPKEENLKIFYRKLLKDYECEDEDEYVERVEYIFKNVYPELDCRLDLNWAEQIDHYYTVKYGRDADECDACYYPRVLKRWDGETFEHYKQRMACLVESVDEEDFSHITFVDTELGYQIGVKSPDSKPRDDSDESSEENVASSKTTKRKSRKEKKSVDQAETEVSKTCACGSKNKSKKKSTKVKKELEEEEEEVTSQSYRVAYTELPKKCVGKSDLEYYKEYFGTYDFKSITEEIRNELYLRILIQYKGESCADYVKRVDFLFDNVYPELDIRTNANLLSFLEHYYKEKYSKKSCETEEEWYSRVLTKNCGETAEHYRSRIQCIQTTCSQINWSKVVIEENSTTGYRLASSQESSSKSVSKSKSESQVSSSEEEIKVKYAKIESEDITTYYKRIITKSTTTVSTEEYVQLITSIRKAYPTLDLWCDIKYLDLVKDYYSALYVKQSSESESAYFKRIVTKESYETDEVFAKRLEVVHRLYPTLSLWCSDKYYKDYTKAYYQTYYKQITSEDEITYYTRITSKLENECDEDYINRITLIIKTYPTLPVWYSKDYLSLTRNYFITKYSKLSTEKEEVYYQRIVTKESYETDEEWANRVEVVRELYPTLPLWYDAKYYTTTKKYIETIYKRSKSEDETTYYTRIVTKSEKESTSEYYNRISLIKNTFSTLPIWYDSTYLSITKDYFVAKYTKLSTEEDEVYFKRIVTREDGETDETWAKRIEIIHSLHPSLALWYESKYYNTYTKEIYSSIYKKLSSEDEITYYTRICHRLEQESPVTYAKRLTIIRKTLCDLDLWYSDKYFNIVKEYYSLTYAKQAKETEEAYIERVFKRESFETDVIYVKRVHILQSLFASNSVWSKSCYFDKYLNTYYHNYYAYVEGQSYEAWLTSVLTQLSGETDDIAVARVALIKRAVSVDCWTDELLTKVAKSCSFSSEYIAKLRSTCFTVTSCSCSSSSSVSSSSSSASSANEEEVTLVSRG